MQMQNIKIISLQNEQLDERQSYTQVSLKQIQLQQNSINNFSPKSINTKQNGNQSKNNTPINSKYKLDSFSNICNQQQQSIQNKTISNGNSQQNTPSVRNEKIGNYRKPSQLSINSQDKTTLQGITPSAKQIKEYIDKNSITGLLGVRKLKKQMIDSKTLSQFSRIQKNLDSKDQTQQVFDQIQKKKQMLMQKTQQSSTSNNQFNTNFTNGDDSMYDTNTKKYEYLLDVEVHKADIFQKWVPQQHLQQLQKQKSLNPAVFQLNLSSLKRQQNNTQTVASQQTINNTSSSQNLSSKRKIKYFKENVDKRKRKEMKKENESLLNKELRRFGKFVEFSKVGPARNITCLQTRIDYLFNKIPSESGSAKQPLQIYSQGTPIGSDITKWKLTRPQSSNSFFVSQVVQKKSVERASKIVQKLDVQIENDTREQKERNNYNIRSNLDSVVKNIRSINLNQQNASLNKTNISISQYSTVNTPKLTLDFQSPRGYSPSISLVSPQSTINNNKDFQSPTGVFLRPNSSVGFARDLQKDSIKEQFNTHSQIINNDQNNKQLNQNSIQNKYYSLQQTPIKYNKEDRHKKSNFTSIGLEEQILEQANEQEQFSPPRGSVSNRESRSPIKMNKNLYSKSYNNIEITNQRFTQQELRSKINSFYEKNKTSNKHSKKPSSISSQVALSLYQQVQGNKKNQKIDINQQLDRQAINKALKELDQAEYDNDKLIFDPNCERIKRKRRLKQKLRKLLIKCAKMNIKAKDINTVSIFSTIPYENKGSFAFIEAVKKGQNQQVIQQLEKNIYYVSDFDQFHMTALHHACKKGNLFLAKYLISKGAEIDAQDSMKRTPLYYALITENKQLVKELLQLKCSPWSGDQFSFLKQNLPQEILNILSFVKNLDIICKLQFNLQEREKIWKKEIEILKLM
ncbi:CRAL/TRIO domain protein (macronuclear) [Tetrahymena thermophila SB210]|uniref:CRAL/TRIO domain protein n=1 Tax=Tetrahymena thermophila (strain SB210) TaxID=312017 RepID=I7M7Y5_TETTS|nr:CRAL/TRIO domain protein [Tetrahymena thermophila SB210]EAR96268.3 CRAL/TRIO domain protein [Tetrahymena thermophila SB210]|eukprot:XP_001016513.3 CRAL/TRIO domain protein [Tetrahymena thermophila SB210]